MQFASGHPPASPPNGAAGVAGPTINARCNVPMASRHVRQHSTGKLLLCFSRSFDIWQRGVYCCRRLRHAGDTVASCLASLNAQEQQGPAKRMRNKREQAACHFFSLHSRTSLSEK